MKSYPSIEYFGDYWGLPVIAFDKLDGSNLRFEWGKKRGFYKFGTRNVMIDEKSEQFGKAIPIFLKKYSESLEKIFKQKEYRDTLSFVCFAEFLGKKSSYGQHEDGDEFDVTLFDVNQYKKGFIKPREFVKNFGHLDIPKIVYDGNLNKEFVRDVQDNKFDLKEGVICKGSIPGKKSDQLYYCKIKTNRWLDDLRIKYGEKAVEEELKKHSSIIEI
jgi:hypothetical protein